MGDWCRPNAERTEACIHVMGLLVADRCCARLGLSPEYHNSDCYSETRRLRRLNVPNMTPEAIRDVALERARAGALDDLTGMLVGHLLELRSDTAFWKDLATARTVFSRSQLPRDT